MASFGARTGHNIQQRESAIEDNHVNTKPITTIGKSLLIFMNKLHRFENLQLLYFRGALYPG